MMNQNLFFFLARILGFSLLVVLASLYIPAKIHSQEDLNNIALGLPFPYVMHDFSHYTPLVFPLWLPVVPLPIAGSILWGNFLLSWLIVTVFLLIVLVLVNRALQMLMNPA